MHIVATVIKAGDLFEFAEEEGIADYFGIQELIEDGDPKDHFMWNLCSCFSVTRDSLLDLDWVPQATEMVRRYMTVYDIEVLVIVTGTDAHVGLPPRK